LILNEVREAARKRILFLPHAIAQMSRLSRMISAEEIRSVIMEGKIIEDYPNDIRGHSCLMKGYGNNGRAIHIVCAPKEEYLAIITAYLPTDDLWSGNFTIRRIK